MFLFVLTILLQCLRDVQKFVLSIMLSNLAVIMAVCLKLLGDLCS
jgi:hypothetical protein